MSFIWDSLQECKINSCPDGSPRPLGRPFERRRSQENRSTSLFISLFFRLFQPDCKKTGSKQWRISDVIQGNLLFFRFWKLTSFNASCRRRKFHNFFFFFRSKLFIWVALPPPLPAVETRRGGFPSRTDLENNLIFDLLRVGRCLPDVDFCPASHLPVYRLAPSFLAPPVSIFRSIRTVAISQVHVSSFFFFFFYFQSGLLTSEIRDPVWLSSLPCNGPAYPLFP